MCSRDGCAQQLLDERSSWVRVRGVVGNDSMVPFLKALHHVVLLSNAAELPYVVPYQTRLCSF